MRKAVCMPQVGAAFALEEKGARGLVACALVARVAGARDVIGVEFGVADVVKDIQGEGTEASSALLLDF